MKVFLWRHFRLITYTCLKFISGKSDETTESKHTSNHLLNKSRCEFFQSRMYFFTIQNSLKHKTILKVEASPSSSSHSDERVNKAAPQADTFHTSVYHLPISDSNVSTTNDSLSTWSADDFNVSNLTFFIK